MSTATVPSDPEDQRILEVAREVGRQLGVSKFYPERVVWRPGISSDQCVFMRRHFKVVVLPETMKGSLEPEEWRPLMASSLLWDRIPPARRLRNQAILFVPLFFSSWFIVSQTVPPFWSKLFVLALGLPICAFMLVRAFQLLTKGMLMADELAAKLFGKEVFLQVLMKID